jgi:hypothetical protein
LPTNFNSFARFDIRAYCCTEAVQFVITQSVETIRIFAAYLNSRDQNGSTVFTVRSHAVPKGICVPNGNRCVSFGFQRVASPGRIKPLALFVMVIEQRCHLK